MADWQAETKKAALRYGLDPYIFTRQIRQESGFNPDAVSGAGAIGIAQIMPGTARGWGVDPHDPRASLDAAAKNMAEYVKKYGSYRDALVAYNAGPGRVGGALPTETQNYISTILINGRDPGKLGQPSTSSSPTSTPTVPHGLSAADPVQSLTSAIPPAGNPAAAAALIQQLSASRRQPVASSSLQPPAVSAGPVLPDAYRALTSTQGPAPRQDIGALLSMVQTQGADLGAGPAQSDAGAPQTPANGSGGGPATPSASGGPAKFSGLVPLGGSKNAGKGAFTISGPSPDRLKPALTSYADKVAYIYGGSLTGLDGSTHSKFTVNGNVSEHYTGNATDVFGIGGLKYGQDGWTQQLIRAGRAALIAAGMPRAQALKQTGGLYNVGDHQIIFNVNGDQYGGNHLDHLHISTHAS